MCRMSASICQHFLRSCQLAVPCILHVGHSADQPFCSCAGAVSTVLHPKPAMSPWRARQATQCMAVLLTGLLQLSSWAIAAASDSGLHHQGNPHVRCSRITDGVDLSGDADPATINPHLQWGPVCYTVCQSYASAATAQHHVATHNKQQQLHGSHVRKHYVVLLTLHRGLQYTPEFMVHLSSLIAEAQPMPVRFLYHCKSSSDLQLLPAQVRHRAFAYTDDAIRSAYFPEPINKSVRKSAGRDWDIRFHTDLPVLLFMRSHPFYDFAWVMEDDVRLIGNWGGFFHTAGLAAKAELASRNASGEPDLTTFHPVCNPPGNWMWDNTAVDIPQAIKCSTLLTLRGYSRHLFRRCKRTFCRGFLHIMRCLLQVWRRWRDSTQCL